MTAGLLIEKFSQPLLSVLEDPLHVAAHEQPMDPSSPARAIADVVQAERAPIAVLKGVRVMPERVRTAELHIHEAMRRIPFGNLGAPADGNAMHADAVVSQRPPAKP